MKLKHDKNDGPKNDIDDDDNNNDDDDNGAI